MATYDETPVNYSTGGPDPSATFAQGVQTGNQIQTGQLQQQQQEIQLNQLKSYQTDMQQLASQGYPPQGVAQLALKYPAMSEQISKGAALMDDAQRQAKLSQAIPLMAGMYSKNYQLVSQKLNEQADAFDAAGRTQDAAQARTMAQIVTQHPEAATGLMASYLASIMGPKVFPETFTKIHADSREQELHPTAVRKAEAGATIEEAKADVAPQQAAGEAAQASGKGKQELAAGAAAPTTVALKNADTQSQIAERAARLGLDTEKLNKDTALRNLEIQMKNPLINPTPEVRAGAGKAANTAAAADQLADRVDSLADQFGSHSDWLTGGLGRGLSFFKEKLGINTTYQQLMQQAALVRGPVVKNIIMAGGGIQRITDSDLKVFAAGVPDASAPPSQQISFLRGFAKAQRLESITNQARADWIFQNSFEGRAIRDLNIMGITVPTGTNFNEFLHANSASLLKQELGKAAKTSVEASPYAPYMQPQSQAQPAAPSTP